MTDVYRNLTRSCFSVREGGRVVAHVPEIALADVALVVQPGARARVLRTGVREVHAWCRGTRTEFVGVPAGAVEVGYSPWHAPHFTSRPGFSKLLSCRVVVFTNTGRAYALI